MLDEKNHQQSPVVRYWTYNYDNYRWLTTNTMAI